MTSPADPRPPGPDPKGPAAPINPSGTAGRLLNQITTRWSIVNDPAKVVVRYAPAIRSYLEAILRNPNDADEVAQEFALHVLNHKFDKASPDRGRFRDYVKVSARNAALIYLRKKTRAGKATALTADVERTLANPAAGNDPAAAASDEWLNHWRRCLLDKVWRSLESHELRSPGNLYYTALRLSVDFPQEDSESLAARAAATAGRPLRADAFRKQLSRARRMFAELLAEEVAATLQQPTPVEIEEELAELGLMSYLRDYLPEEEA
jgi:hypothetical protein